MVKYPTILNLNQKDINRQFYKMILDSIKNADNLEDAIDALETTVGNSSSGLVKDVSTLKTTVGGATSGLVKNVTDLASTVGSADSGLVKDVSDIDTAIGDETTEGSILYRIKALEDAP